MPSNQEPSALRNAVSLAQIEASAVRVPLPRVVMAASTPLVSRDYLCLEITASDGVVGIGFPILASVGLRPRWRR